MTKQKSTKRALLASGLALFMCISMFVGSTFAWFTDSVKTGVNTIQAGTLDIVLEYKDANGVWQDAEGKTLNFKAADGRENILWEPGCTYELPAIRVRNNGNLALKYEILINGINGDAKLLEAIEFTTKLGDASEASVYSFADYLAGDKKESAPIVIKGHMKETAGNEYQGLSIEGLGITVVATQYTYEKDSYNELYDELATYMNKNANGEWEIESVGQLVYLSKSVNEGKDYAGETIVLTKDLDLAGINWAPIGNFTYDINTNGDGYVYGETFKGTFDGQGHTIKNLYVNAPSTSGVGLFGYVTDATVKNLTIENVKLNALSHVAAFVARSRGTATVTNCKLIGDIDINAYWAYVAGIVGKAYAINLDGCSVAPNGTGKITSENRNAVGSILAWMETASTVSNCKAQDLNLTGWANIGGITGFVSGKSTINNCSAENMTITKTRVDGHPSVGLISGGWNGKPITITNNTAKGITFNGTVVAWPSANILYGSEFYGALDDTGFVLSNNVQENITNNLVDVTVVKTADALADAVAQGGTIILMNDINVNFADTAYTVAKNNSVKIDLNGHDIIATSANTTSAQLFSVSGNLEIVGEGTVSLKNDNFAWNTSYRYTTINIRETGVVTLGEGVNVICEAGAATAGGYGMSYAVDIYTTGTLNVNGASLHSNYIAVRCFYGNSVVNVNSGPITSSRNNWGIWPQSAPGAIITIANGISYTTDSYGIYIFD